MNIEISVYCLAYNCISFIEKSIKNMLNQKINVEYEIIIHDDASDDGTSDIIKKYAEKYPDKIKAILQTENQYSKGVDIERDFIFPNIKGKYIAICEGDDYWIDENKLQIQYNYMEHHPNCSLCVHNTNKLNLTTKKTRTFNDWKTKHILTPEDIFVEWSVHTSSFFLRKNCVDWPGNSYWFGDYMMLTWSFFRGNVVCLPQIMSQYNAQNPNGVTFSNAHQNIRKMVSTYNEIITYLHEYNVLTHYKYDKYVQLKVELVKFQCLMSKNDNLIMKSKSKENSIRAAKMVREHECYPFYINKKKGILRLVRRYRYEGYFFYPLWIYIMKKSLNYRFNNGK